MIEVNETHAVSLRSWVESANDPGSDFPLQNLPLCRFEATHDDHTHEHVGMGIGDRIVDLSALAETGYFDADDDGELGEMLLEGSWTWVVRLGILPELRRRVQRFLDADAPAGQSARRLREKVMRAMEGTVFVPAFDTLGYTDFYASVHHATNVGSMFRPDNALLPNYKWMPIGYHGRASSIVASGTPIVRPRGQMKADDAASPEFGPCRMLDYELEVGVVIGEGNELGEPIGVDEAEDHVAGLCLVNDWSARDVQKWEYQPLGPFLAKNFATTVGAFVVTAEALAPFRCAAMARAAGDPEPMAHLRGERDRASGGYDITLEVLLSSSAMREKGMEPMRLSRGSFREMYWTFSQMIAHHTSGGCNLMPGDLIASGTVSGAAREARGCLLELTWDGDPWAQPPRVLPGSARTPIRLPTGEERRFLADGDEVVMRGWCEREGFRRIGFGECRGLVMPARSS